MQLTAAAARTTTSGLEEVSCEKRRADYKAKAAQTTQPFETIRLYFTLF